MRSININLDPARLTLCSLRPGTQIHGIAAIQEAALNAAAVQNHGHWAGNTGERVYQDRMLSRSKAQALYSTGIYTFAVSPAEMMTTSSMLARVAAPMVGQSDPPFRTLCLQHGATCVFTEMLYASLVAHSLP